MIATLLRLNRHLGFTRLASFHPYTAQHPRAIQLVMAKRKHSAIASIETSGHAPPPILTNGRSSKRVATKASTNPDVNPDVVDAPDAWRPSPDSDINEAIAPSTLIEADSDSSLSDAPTIESPKKKPQARKKAGAKPVNGDADAAPKTLTKAKLKATTADEEIRNDPDADEEEGEADPEEIKKAVSRPPPVNSDYLPLPWKGRIGYACLCTYLRYSNPPVFTSRTTRIASILEHRHPLKDPSQPEHATKNRPDKDQPADIRRGQQFVENLAVANCKDMIKMLRWNDKYNIKFFRLSSEAFPFASHPEYGYKLAPFAADVLAEVGKVVAELGHRVTTHPGQFTQLGSPRQSVIDNAFRDLEYHDEMLSLLKLPEQQNKDAIMVLHLGGVFGDKEATLDRFRANYAKLSQSVKNRLVLENDDMSWGVHDLLPICKELNIPMVLDFHHHNIIFDPEKIREGTKDIMELFPEIRETWTRKGITQKMHYSEPTPQAITGSQRRKHSPRVASLPPCPPDMDLMIEAKDKEQAVFELMKNFRLPGYERFSEIIPHTRKDDNKPVRPPPKKKTAAARKKSKKVKEEEEDEDTELIDAELEDATPVVIPEEEVGMGGPEGRVYWPPTMEEYLRPMKRIIKKKEPDDKTPKRMTTAQRKAAKEAATAAAATEEDGEDDSLVKEEDAEEKPTAKKAKPALKKATNGAAKKRAAPKKIATPSTSDDELEEEQVKAEVVPVAKTAAQGKKPTRAAKKKVSYAEEEATADEE